MEIKLSAVLREKNERLGRDFVPAVVYGKSLESRSLKIVRADLEKVARLAGESNLISLEFDGSSLPVLIKEIQRDVLKGFLSHVDFYQVNMKESVNTEIPLHFVGESKAVRELGGTLITEMDSLEIECLPGDLVDHIDVDISSLNSFDDAIRVNDLKLPRGIALVHHTNEMVAAVRESRVEAEADKTAAAPVAAPAPETKKP